MAFDCFLRKPFKITYNPLINSQHFLNLDLVSSVHLKCSTIGYPINAFFFSQTVIFPTVLIIFFTIVCNRLSGIH